MFKQKDERKTTSSFETLAYDRLHHHEVSDKMDIHSTRVMRGANCCTDHQMLRSKVAFIIRQKHNNRQESNKPTKLNTAKLSIISHRESFEQEMDSALAQWEEKENSTPDEEWAALQQVVYNTVKDIYWQARQKKAGLVRPQRPGATYSYKHNRRSPPESVANQEHYIHHCSLQQCLQTATQIHPCTEVGLVGKEAVELQRAADRNYMKDFYSGLKEVWGPKKKGPVQLKSTYGM